MPKVVPNRKLLKSIRNSAHPFSVQEQLQLEQLPSSDLLQSIADHLCNALPAERSLGTDMVSQFLTENRLHEITGNEKSEKLDSIIRKLAVLLLDRAENVRFGSIDALCYLSSQSDELCDRLVENELLESIVKFFETFLIPIQSWAGPDSVKVTDKKLTSNIFVDCFNLLTNLCGTSSKSIPILLKYRDQFSTIICKGLQPAIDVPVQSESIDFTFFPISIAAAQFLSVITEDSTVYQRFIVDSSVQTNSNGTTNNDSSLPASISDSLNLIVTKFEDGDQSSLNQLLSKLQFNQILYLKSFLIFIACQQLSSTKIELQQQQPFEQLLKLIQSTFNEFSPNQPPTNDISTDEQILKFVSTLSADDLSSEMRHLQSLEPEYDEIRYRYLTKRNCLELLTNLTSVVDVDEDELNDDDEEELVNDDDITDEDMMVCDEDGCDNPILAKFIQDSNILQILIVELNRLEHTFKDEQNVRSTLMEHIFGKDICMVIQSYHTSALTLIHNLISSKFLTSSGSSQLLPQIWSIVGQLSIKTIAELQSTTNGQGQSQSGNNEEQVARSEIVEEAINVIRAFLTNFKELSLSMDDLKLLYTFASLRLSNGTNAASFQTKVNVIRIMASVASSLILNQHKVDVNQSSELVDQIVQITGVLLEAYSNLSTQTQTNRKNQSVDNLILKAEILDSIIDIYSDDNPISDQIIRKIDLLGKLVNCGTSYRKDLKDGANRQCSRSNPVVGTVRLNLNRFIEYKRKHLRN